MSLLFELVGGVTAQRPAHSLFIAGVQLPLEARLGGLFCGLLITIGYCLFLGRARVACFPRRWLAAALLGLVGPLAVDGLNALLFDLGRPHLYAPDNGVRFATGLLCGLALAVFVLPSAATALWKESDWEAALQTVGELLGGLGLLAVTWFFVSSDLPWMALPAALLMVSGVICALVLANVSLIGVVRPWRVADWRRALWPLGWAFGLALVELVGLRLLHPWVFPAGALT